MTTVKTADIELKINQTCEYKSNYGQEISIGKIVEFRKMDEGIIWMCIVDLETQKKEWYSVNNWLQYYREGLFSKKIQIQDDTDTEPEDNEKYPF